MFLKRIKCLFNLLSMKLFICFVIIIVIFVTFNVCSLKYYNHIFKNEILTYDTKIFNSSISRYNDYFLGLFSTVYSIELNEKANKIISSNKYWQYEMADVMNILKTNVPFIDNIFIVFQNKELAISQYGTCMKEVVFKHITSNCNIPTDEISNISSKNEYINDITLWDSFYSESSTIKYLPSAMYRFPPISNKLQLPLIYIPPDTYKQHPSGLNYYFLIIIDIEGLYKSINKNSDPYFYMFANNDFIYTSNEKYIPDFNNLLDSKKNIIISDFGYVLFSDNNTSLPLYIKIYPFTNMNIYLLKINIIFAFGLIFLILLVVIISIFFSHRFGSPITKIAKTLSQSDTYNITNSNDVKTSIPELKHIVNRFKCIFSENRILKEEMSNKNSILQYYLLFSRIKDIKSTRDMNFFSNNFSNYIVVLCKIIFKEYFWEKYSLFHEKILDLLKNFFDIVIESKYPDSTILQIENDQFISIVNINDNSVNTILDALGYVKDITSIDKDYYTIIVSISDVYKDTSQLNEAYNEVFRKIKHMKLSADFQIILNENVFNTTSNSFYFTSAQENNLKGALIAGDKSTLITLIDNILNENIRRNISVYFLNKLSIEIINIFVNFLDNLKVSPVCILEIIDLYEMLDSLYFIEDYRKMMYNLIDISTRHIREKKKDYDYINNFVLEYIEKNYKQDIYRDLIAEKLKISPNYLSSYFKEKNGVNFLDYLNTFRVKKAKILLQTGSMKIQDIATETGFNSIHSFIRTFKHYTGKTPSEYKKEFH